MQWLTGEDTTARLLRERSERLRAQELANDPSDIPGMTQTELDGVINTGTIRTSTLRQILD